MAEIVRFLFAIMLCVANMIVYGLKVNISTTIIGMTKAPPNASAGGTVDQCPQYKAINGSSRANNDGPFDWSSTEQGLIVSLYFVGYFIGMFPAGYLADRFNAKRVLLICVLGNAIFTLLVPLAAHNIVLLYVLRFLTGLVSAPNVPVVNVLVAKWVVYEERSTWVGIIYAGTSLGTVVSILSSGLIMNHLNWESVFYIHGALPLLWCVTFAIFFADNPETQKFITESERNRLTSSYGHRGPVSARVKVPWLAILTSGPFWALIFTNAFGNFGWYFLLTQLPLYMSRMLKYDIKARTVISCIPYLLSAIANPLLGKLLDIGRRQGYWTQTGARKIAVAISCFPPAILMIVIAYIGCEREATTIMLIASIVFGGVIFIGHATNHNDLAPNYAGTLMGITNTPGTTSAFILPALVGTIMHNGHTFERWRIIFWITIGAQMAAAAIFMVFGSAKIQDWNYPEGKSPVDPSDFTTRCSVKKAETRQRKSSEGSEKNNRAYQNEAFFGSTINDEVMYKREKDTVAG